MVGIFCEHSKGVLKDGRKFEIIDFRNFAFSDDGNIQDGLIGVLITDETLGNDGIYGVYCVSDFAKMIDYESLSHNKI